MMTSANAIWVRASGLSSRRRLTLRTTLSVRRVLLQLSSAYPWKDLYTHAFHALRC